MHSGRVIIDNTGTTKKDKQEDRYSQPADATDGAEESFDDEEGEQTRRDGAQATHADLRAKCPNGALRVITPVLYPIGWDIEVGIRSA